MKGGDDLSNEANYITIAYPQMCDTYMCNNVTDKAIGSKEIAGAHTVICDECMKNVILGLPETFIETMMENPHMKAELEGLIQTVNDLQAEKENIKQLIELGDAIAGDMQQEEGLGINPIEEMGGTNPVMLGEEEQSTDTKIDLSTKTRSELMEMAKKLHVPGKTATMSTENLKNEIMKRMV